ncbi:MAG: hypothetical protein ABL929_09615 [Ferruginibacter sp.]|nr:hypothetical protein [Ferruginibacter sp.]
MKWKIFLTLCASTFLISFPQNIIGCGASIDEYDYYTSFFNPDISASKELRPFYYTGYSFLYNSDEPASATDVLTQEWQTYCGNKVTTKDTKAFVMDYSQKDVANIYYSIEKNKPLKIADSIKQNSMTKYFLQQKDMEALGYIMYAKNVEPHVNNSYNNWEPTQRDSLAMAKLIKNGQQLYAASKKEIFKLKYAYQIIRLAHYNKNYIDAIAYYNNYIPSNNTQSILKPLSLALKAGALFRSGNNKEAVYLFSKAFSETDVKKISNFVSFNWSLNPTYNRDEYLNLCKNNEEKSNLLSLLALSSEASETNTIEKIYTLNSQNKNIQTLIAREINKLESSYFTPLLNTQKGGKLFYYSWIDTPTDSLLDAGKNTTEAFTKLLLKMSNAKDNNAGLYLTTAAYCALMTKDFAEANTYLTTAKNLSLLPKVKEQWMLTNLLLAINDTKNIDEKTEEKLLPSIKWLQQKAFTENSNEFNWSNFSQWKNFYRNIFTVALAKKYHAQGNVFKEALCVGAADKIYGNDNYNCMYFLHNETDIKDVENLYTLMINKKNTEYEKYLIKNNAIKISDVSDFAGTAYLRNYDYKNAKLWLEKTGATKTDTIFKSAFIELLDDAEARLPLEKKTTSKLLFVQEMLQAQSLVETDKTNQAKHLYKMATGMYNMTYYGHAWELVQYYRSSSDGYSIPKDATDFQKQYYGCFAAHDMFKKAMNASSDKNFKAKCLFMMAKCSQKQVGKPQYSDFGQDYDKYDKAEKEFLPKFMNNIYFPLLKQEYSSTDFYKEAYSRCSYLRDFEKRNK